MTLKKSKKQNHTIPVTDALRNLSPKTMAMISLLAVMGLLWGRVLLRGKGGPAAASAAQMDVLGQSAQTDSGQPLQIKAVSLPQLPGRNDALSADIFSMKNWSAFGLNGDQDGNNNAVETDSSEDADKMKFEQIAQRLVLEAVIQDAEGNPSQAFVEGKILSVGSTLTVKEGPDQYVLTMEKISQKEVLLSWNGISIVLKMAETFEL